MSVGRLIYSKKRAQSYRGFVRVFSGDEFSERRKIMRKLRIVTLLVLILFVVSSAVGCVGLFANEDSNIDASRKIPDYFDSRNGIFASDEAIEQVSNNSDFATFPYNNLDWDHLLPVYTCGVLNKETMSEALEAYEFSDYYIVDYADDGSVLGTIVLEYQNGVWYSTKRFVESNIVEEIGDMAEYEGDALYFVEYGFYSNHRGVLVCSGDEETFYAITQWADEETPLIIEGEEYLKALRKEQRFRNPNSEG